jgi:hypothetical protein
MPVLRPQNGAEAFVNSIGKRQTHGNEQYGVPAFILFFPISF